MTTNNMNNISVSRRTFLRASGIAVALPFLESMPGSAAAAGARRRMVAINVGLGLHAPNLIPTTSGRDYELTPYLKVIGDYRDSFTVISGASHPEVGGGHLSGKSYLTAAKHPNSAGFTNSISIDQFAAEQLGAETRYGSLALTSSGPGLSWSRAGVEVPAQSRPSQVFAQLFLAGKPQEQAEQIQRLQDGKSVLDVVRQKAKRMGQRLAGRDRAKLDQYFDAVREAEQRLVKAETWEARPKPQVDIKAPQDQNDSTRIVERMQLMYEMMHLAIQTDSTRFITYYFTGMNQVPSIQGVDIDYHNLSHHGKDPAKLAQLAIVETEVMLAFGNFLKKLAESEEAGSSLLDKTMVLFGSNLGNASSHDTKNMPIILAGGGFKHGQHLAFDQQNNYPLPNLYVSMLQRLGLQTNSFASSTGTLSGLEAA